MGGPNLEVFKFGFYLFFPIAMMLHIGDPDWYKTHVLSVSTHARPLNLRILRTDNSPVSTNPGYFRRMSVSLR